MEKFFNILIISHGTIAQSYLETLAMITGGPLVGVEACSIMEGESHSDLTRRIVQSMERVRCPGGVLMFVDMFGGTPCNVAMAEFLGHNSRTYLLAGLSLPMLLAAMVSREGDLEQVAREVLEAGRVGMVDVNSRVAAAAKKEDNE